MKNKRLLICLIVFILVSGLAVLGGTVFRVKTVEILFANEPEAEYIADDIEQTKANLRNAVSFLQGKNILFDIDRAKIVSEIESADRRIRWTNTEAKFPNKVVITVRERYPVFYYTEGTTNFVMDATLRIVTNIMPDRTGKAPLIDISDEFSASLPGLPSLHIGKELSDYLTDEQDIVKAETLVDMMAFFAGGGYFEDSTRHLFDRIEFSTLRGELDLIIEVGSEIIIEIQDVEVDFADKLTNVWHTMENECHNFPGLYQVFNLDGKLTVLPPEAWHG